ncbi:MAG TPA: translocation/assembly module TamB domain-containing protein, partial [Novosphingobium sp.]|nr:translocation/assembly module TamB domain-containing protein [Novosphingobium sp.]
GWRLPVDLAVARLGTGNGALDPQLARGRAHATFTFAKGQLAAPDLALSWPALRLALALKAEPARGAWALAGRASSSGWPVAGVGRISGQAGLALTSARGQGWRLGVDLKGAAAGLKDGSLAALVGDSARLSARLAADSAGRMDLSQAALTGPRLSLALSGQRRADGGFAFAGHGQQVTYGAFSATGSWGRDGPHGEVRLADPLPVLGVKQVVVGITPAPAGAALAITGQSMLGPMDGTLALALPKDGPARLDVRRLAFSGTVAAGSLRLAGGGVDGALSLSGGGVNGSVELARRDGGQAVDLSLRLTNAHFGGDQPLTIGLAHLEANGLIRRDHTTIAVAGLAQGVGKGRLFIGRLAANAKLEDGSGTINVALGGRRGSRFDLEAQARVAPEKMDLLARGSFGNQPISMPQRARLAAERRPDGGFAGWRLAPAEVDYGGGRVMAEGFLGNGSMDLKLGVVDMPLSLGDVVFADMGLSGRATGLFNWTQQREQMPEANAELMIKGLSRAGLTTTSRPVDVALVGRLEKTALQLRARAAQGGQQNGRLQARVDNLPEQGTLAERLAAGRLFAQLRYGGPADALWRLMALNDLDLSGPVDLAADITGSLRDPLIRGSLAGDDLRLQGPQMGMDITHMATRASFDGSRLVFARLAGKTAGNGEVSGSGMVDFTALGHKGPAIDLRLAAKKAQLVGRADMSLAVTGPLRIVSDGESGTIAGRVVIDMARWRLGQAADVAEIPVIATQESNRRADIAPASAREVAWSFLVDGAGGNVRLQGLGLDSIWRAAIRLRGPLDDPSLQGHADLLSGSYEFAGKRFDLTRGLITMDGTTPTDPRLDIAATASVSDINATVTVRGSALRPEITFSSVPPMPEEELLSRLLFGTSVTSISAPEAVQLGTAVASLHGGGGLDPINRLRGAIGVDRLRIISADPAQDRQTGLAVGKYLGRRVYAEVVSDGRGYSATNLEFRLTSWLALLGTVSTIGRQSVNAKITHDY